MAVKPVVTIPEWTDGDAAKVVEPGAPLKLSGWVAEKPPFQIWNWLQYATGKWLTYCDTVIDEILSAASSLAGRVTTAEGTIANHGPRITAAESDISTNTGDIGTNTSAISGHETRLTTAEGNITGHGTRLDTAEAAITGLGGLKAEVVTGTFEEVSGIPSLCKINKIVYHVDHSQVVGFVGVYQTGDTLWQEFSIHGSNSSAGHIQLRADHYPGIAPTYDALKLTATSTLGAGPAIGTPFRIVIFYTA